MREPVKQRPYNSPRRRAQAEATRRDILDAAQRLFERDGYAATTMPAIAAEASVAPKTVYLAFERKSGVLRALWNLLLRGDHGELPVAEQPWYREVMDDPDPQRQLRLNARNSRRAKERIAATLDVIGSAASTDREIDALWDRIQREYHENQRVIAASLAEKNALRAGLSTERAADILWTLNHPNVWRLLVRERGWTADEYEQWSADTACAQLLAPSVTS
jgi:AcrR family transcriptional regulator